MGSTRHGEEVAVFHNVLEEKLEVVAKNFAEDWPTGASPLPPVPTPMIGDLAPKLAVKSVALLLSIGTATLNIPVLSGIVLRRRGFS